jgi:hypothetical protein
LYKLRTTNQLGYLSSKDNSYAFQMKHPLGGWGSYPIGW